MVRRLTAALAVAALTLLGAYTTYAQQVSKESVEGVSNFARLETTIACAGATKATAVPALKKMGFASIINLRQPSENGANVEEEEAAAKQAGIKYYNIPFNSQAADPAVADKFLATITAPGNDPAFIHCASGNRAAAMWMIKRMVVDHWDADRASAEAAALGLTNAGLKQYALDYAKSHTR
jgi:uncharacterized protein (TIGR01244 family)